MKVRIIRTTSNNDGQLLAKGSIINVNDDFGKYMISCRVAEDYTETPKITKEFKGPLLKPELSKLKKPELQAMAEGREGFTDKLTKKELVDLLCG